MTALLKASLFMSEGSTDKEYHAEVIEVEGGNVVNFRYGRRGGSLASGTKTSSPVDFEQAKKIFDKLVKEKTGKGYSPDVSGSAYQGTENAGNKTDFLPQLLNAISEDEAMRLIKDDDWICQPKMDGERRAVHADEDGNVTGINRKGLAVPLPLELSEELSAISKRDGALRLDGEIIGDVLYVFDTHVYYGNSVRQLWCSDRISLTLTSTFDECNYIVHVPVAVTTEEKLALWNKVKAADGEGIVFKRRKSVVKEGRPNTGGDWLKFKFTERATCLVSSISPTKRSVGVSLYDGDQAVFFGNVTIPINHPIPPLNALVDVEYLYCFKGGSLFQPVFHGQRTDLDVSACSVEQLKYKPDGLVED